MRIVPTIGFILLFYFSAIAIIPPRNGEKPPQYVIDFQKSVQNSYEQGYFAQRFNEKRLIREKVSQGLLPETAITQDTVFAVTLLGQYSNLPALYSQQAFQNLLFDGPNPTGTVTEYYSQISYNQLHFTGSAKGWYTLPGTLEYYTGTNSGLGPQGGPRFVLDLIIAADQTINFADYIQYYDNQGRPRIGFIAAVHSGADAAAGAYNIWSHRWTFAVITGGQPYTTNDIDPVSGLPVLIDGDYAIQPEFGGSNNNNGPLVTIGVFAHEFGHIFGLPDLYDTDYSSEGLGNWCLMAGGTYGGNGNSSHTPVHMSAWCKNRLGWITPINVTTALDNLSVPNVEENPVLYRMWRNASAAPEYFLIENRQKLGFDKNLPESGFLIYHVDETRTNNTNENRYLVDLEEADGLRQLNNGTSRGDAGDPFPGSTNNTRFDILTNPNSKDYNLQNTFVSIRNIRKEGLNMIADFDIGTKPYIAVDSIYLSESTYQNGRVEPGETGNVNIILNNISPAASNSTTFRFSIQEPDIQINNNETVFPFPGNAVNTIVIPSAFFVSPDFKSRMITLHYEIISENNTYSDSIEVVVGIPDILIISRAEQSSHSNFYKNALLANDNFFEDSFNTEFEYLSKRNALIILSGKNKLNLFTQTEIDSFITYIDNGGQVFFSGQNIAEFLEADFPNFLHSKIGISWVKNLGPLTRNAYGISNDYFGNIFSSIRFFGGDGASNELTPDVISAYPDFNISLTYKSDGTDPAGGWIENTSSNSKIFFLGFGFESINNSESSITKNQLIRTILNWFDIPTSIDVENDITVSDYTLFQNYPNPFNPKTVIGYQLPVTGKVVLKVYDILGNEIVNLVDEIKSAGKYKVEFNASNLSSGLYLYRLEAAGQTQVKKMILLK